MATKIDLGGIKDPDMPQSQEDILRIIDGALNSSGNSSTAAARLADDLRQFFIQKESARAASALLWDLWMVLLDAVRIVPIEHPWHAALVAAIEKLRSAGGQVVNLEDCKLNWADLPHLAEYIFDKWVDPTDSDDYDTEDLDEWKRFNSFASRLLSDDFLAWIALPYWEIRAALEKSPPQDAAAFECKLWVATEWFTRCGQLLYKDISSAEPLDDRELTSIATGPLCEGVHPRSLERWKFWRSRLTELASTEPSVVLSDASRARIAQAIAAIDAVSNST
ncbi:hypothetical protein VTH82DRAFT_6504 [Thermothelomyces myriococcoides]